MVMWVRYEFQQKNVHQRYAGVECGFHTKVFSTSGTVCRVWVRDTKAPEF